MSKRSFTEYLNTKSKIEKPEVKVVADKVDLPKDREVKPPSFLGMTGKKNNYAQPQADGDSKKVKFGKKEGLGDIAHDKEMYYDVTKDKKPAKIPTAESYIHVFPKARSVVQESPELINQLVREFKNNGLLSVLVAELATHKETFKHLAELMSSKEYGQDFCNKLIKSIKEDIAPPVKAGDEEEEAPADAENDEEKMPEDAEQDPKAMVAAPKPEAKPALEHLIHSLQTI